jgi:hypothetical protein
VARVYRHAPTDTFIHTKLGLLLPSILHVAALERSTVTRGAVLGARWSVDETYVMIAGTRAYVYRAIDEHGQVVNRPMPS